MVSTKDQTTTPIGVGFDTARYGHHATFLREDRQHAAKPLEFLESRSGYQRLERALDRLAGQHTNPHFYIRVDVAGQYAANLLHFLHQLPWPKTISVGEPTRNKRYRQVHFPKRKSDPTESHACARFAIVERPSGTAVVSPEMLTLREVASRLQFQVKRCTREVNRLHNLLSRVFPELATIQNDLQAGWVLKLLAKYPSAQRIAQARLTSIIGIPYLSEAKARQIHEAARQSVASQSGTLIEELVGQSVLALQQAVDAKAKIEKMLLDAFDALPDESAKQIATIKGIGRCTAAVLVAKIASIERFPTADHLTSYFGVFPEEKSSGVDKYGNPIPSAGKRMSRKGNDLVRKYLWMAAKSAIGCNPAVGDLYKRLRARGRRGDVALGHCMRKLVHQVFGIWSSGQVYDPDYRPAQKIDTASTSQDQRVEEQPAKDTAAGRKTGSSPNRKAVTATVCTIGSAPKAVNQPADVSSSADDTASRPYIDFPYLRSQITMERVLRHLGYFDRLRGRGPQRRGPCPVHGAKRDRGRTFSVHLDKNVHQCFHPPCGACGNVIDLWCQVHQLTDYEAALHLAETFDLQLTRNTEERNT